MIAACLGEIERGRLGAIIVVAVHVEDLLAIDREQSRKDTLGQASAENNDLYIIRHKTHALDASLTSYSSSMACQVVVKWSGMRGQGLVIT